MVIYETINKINGKRYIGKDKHNDPNYLGSGVLLNKAIKKYGRENFVKTILEHCDSEDHMAERERQWIKITNAQISKQYYNIGEGGNGGDNITNNPNRDEFIEKMKIINRGENNSMYGKTHTRDTIHLMKERAAGRYTLSWFVNIYGEVLGPTLYNDRNKMLSNRDMKGSSNPSWNEVPKEKLEYLINIGSTQNELMSILNISETCLRNKLELYWNTRSLKEVRNKLNI
jgi:group I intron endonuclease